MKKQEGEVHDGKSKQKDEEKKKKKNKTTPTTDEGDAKQEPKEPKKKVKKEANAEEEKKDEAEGEGSKKKNKSQPSSPKKKANNSDAEDNEKKETNGVEHKEEPAEKKKKKKKKNKKAEDEEDEEVGVIKIDPSLPLDEQLIKQYWLAELPLSVLFVRDVQGRVDRITNSRSNNVVVIEDCKDAEIIVDQNQRFAALYYRRCVNCRFQVLDSAVIASRTTRIIDCTNCTFVFETVDMRKCEVFTSTGCNIVYLSEPALVEVARVLWRGGCSNNKVTIGDLLGFQLYKVFWKELRSITVPNTLGAHRNKPSKEKEKEKEEGLIEEDEEAECEQWMTCFDELFKIRNIKLTERAEGEEGWRLTEEAREELFRLMPAVLPLLPGEEDVDSCFQEFRRDFIAENAARKKRDEEREAEEKAKKKAEEKAKKKAAAEKAKQEAKEKEAEEERKKKEEKEKEGEGDEKKKKKKEKKKKEDVGELHIEKVDKVEKEKDKEDKEKEKEAPAAVVEIEEEKKTKEYPPLRLPKRKDVLAVLQSVIDSPPKLSYKQLDRAYDEERREFEENEQVLKQKAIEAARMIKRSKHCVVYTGAGISTSANIPDFRGPEGIWTRQAKNLNPVDKMTKLTGAVPTYAHYAITELARRNLVKFVISTNMDGLHLRSGLPQHLILEQHGNSYKEICEKCNQTFIRDFDVLNTVENPRAHFTGRFCDFCGGRLKDTIVHFSEAFRGEHDLAISLHQSAKADLVMVLGTSMNVQPNAVYTSRVFKNAEGQMIIINLQKTPYDRMSSLRVFARTDEFMRALMNALEIDDDDFDRTYDAFWDWRKREKERAAENKKHEKEKKKLAKKKEKENKSASRIQGKKN